MRHRLRRLSIPVAIVTAAGTSVFVAALSQDGFGALDACLSVLFVLLFGWIAFWFWLTALGAWLIATSRATRPPSERPRGTSVLPPTAVLIPIHREDVADVVQRIGAMLDSVLVTGHAQEFDFFILSDSPDADTWLAEELGWAELRQRRLGPPNLFYRRRPTKFRKKSGNIADFCERWGDRYRYMIVLDADSIMDGAAMVELVHRMEAVPNLGILQAPSLPALGQSLHARVQQFAASVFGPAIFAGLSYCFQNDATFWGHNAVIRVRPFMEHCGLPALSGQPPFGGPILSHDFVEAGLMRRGGYAVRIAWDMLRGSYEQCPATLSAASERDRRWCQGNLQHLRLIFSPTFLPVSKIHFAIGVFFYAMSACWGAFVLLYATALVGAGDGAAIDRPISVATLGLLLATVGLLLGAKWMSVALVLTDRHRVQEHGGHGRFLASAGLEIVIAALTAPVLMLNHFVCLGSVLFGFSVDWSAQSRSASSTPWRDALREHGWQSAIGIGMALLLWTSGTVLFAWLLPMWLGLALAVPLCAVLSSAEWGRRSRALGLFSTGTETDPQPMIRRLEEESPALRVPPGFATRFWRLVRDPWMNVLHTSLLASLGARSRPRRMLEPLIARTLSEGPESLDEREVLAVLSDPWAMRRLHEVIVGREAAEELVRQAREALRHGPQPSA